MQVREMEVRRTDIGWRVSADIRWEDANRPSAELYFDVEGDRESEPLLDPNTFLLACFPMAVQHGECRIALDRAISPVLAQGLHDVHGWWRQWGFARKDFPAIEAPIADGQDRFPNGSCSTAFLSGGVDSLQMLHRNIQTYPDDHPYRIRKGLLVYGFDIGHGMDRNPRESFQMALDYLGPVASEAGLALTPVYTNLRQLDPDLTFWVSTFHGAALAASAHAALAGRGIVHLASSYDVAHMTPWGSHPLTDHALGTERLSIRHDGVIFSRLAKVRDLASWPTGFASMRVCTQNVPGQLNCGRCEKCVRTKLEILAVGVQVPDGFSDKEVTPDHIMDLWNPYQAACYRELLPYLEASNHAALSAVRRSLHRYERAERNRQLRERIRAIDDQHGGYVRRIYSGARNVFGGVQRLARQSG